METEKKEEGLCDKCGHCRGRWGCHKNKSRHVGSGAYGLGFIGAFIYYIQHATTFWLGVLGFFKAVFWPAVVVYKLLSFLNH